MFLSPRHYLLLRTHRICPLLRTECPPSVPHYSASSTREGHWPKQQEWCLACRRGLIKFLNEWMSLWGKRTSSETSSQTAQNRTAGGERVPVRRSTAHDTGADVGTPLMASRMCLNFTWPCADPDSYPTSDPTCSTTHPTEAGCLRSTVVPASGSPPLLNPLAYCSSLGPWAPRALVHSLLCPSAQECSWPPAGAL